VITPEGITLNGIVPVSSLLLKGERNLKINGSVTTTKTEIISSGYYNIPKGCMKGEYPYKEQALEQTGTFQVIHTYLGAPVVLSFSIEYYKGSRLVSRADLSSYSGVVTLSNVDRYFSVPLPGGAVVTGPVNIGYRIFKDIVHLNNMPHDGNYNLILAVKATDPAGSVESKTEVEFRGNEVNIEGNYQSQLMICFLNFAEDRRRRSLISKFSVHWLAVNRPPPQEIIKVVDFLANEGTEEADNLLSHTKLGHGNSFYRALFSIDTEAKEYDIKPVGN
jgi:hypothetical protein